MGEQEATVLEVQPFGLHGVTYYDVVVRFADQSIQTARLGPEGIPEGLQQGERVMWCAGREQGSRRQVVCEHGDGCSDHGRAPNVEMCEESGRA